VGKVGGDQSSNKASVTDLQELLPVYMYILYQYGPMTEVLEGDLGWVLILAIVELIFYIHGEGEWRKRKAKAGASLEQTRRALRSTEACLKLFM
jgi:hypothetical protein